MALVRNRERRAIPSQAVKTLALSVPVSLVALCDATPSSPLAAETTDHPTEALPPGFVHLQTLDPTILTEVRYAGAHNFIGRPVPGYEAPEVVLTREAAEALAEVQADVRPMGYTLKVYDGYRPQRAVDEFVRWAADPDDDAMRAEFYPDVPKDRLFPERYIAERSGHSRGSTVDLTLVELPATPTAPWMPGDPLRPCTAPHGERWPDNSIDMGTGFDCFSEKSHHGSDAISEQARANREILLSAMERHGFEPYPEEWWHYTLADEPFPDAYFNFPIPASPE